MVTFATIRLLKGLWHLPFYLLQGYSKQQQRKVQLSLLNGSLALIQERWQEAEDVLIKTVHYSELPALHYLGAAYATCHLGVLTRMLDYLSEARMSMPEKELAVTLFQAKLQWQQRDLLAALKSVQRAFTLAPKQDDVLLLLLTLYLQLADWSALIKLLPEIRKCKILSTKQIEDLENRASIALIHYTLRSDSLQATMLWSSIPKATRLRPAVLKVYVQHLMAGGNAATAEPLLRESLKHHWDDDLVILYGELETANTAYQIDIAENWLKIHDKDVTLLLTVGRLCLRHRLWDKAQRYLEESVRLTPYPTTYQMLGDLFTQQNNIVQANEYYRQGLQLVIKNNSRV
jgi:HemY protein